MTSLLGIDFTSAPRRAKPITVAHGRLEGARVVLDHIERCSDWTSFEAVLARPGAWLGAFDFPFGLPREAVVEPLSGAVPVSPKITSMSARAQCSRSATAAWTEATMP